VDIEAIVFDVFGSVVDWRSSVIEGLSAFGQRRGVVADWPSFADAWRARYQPSMQRVRSGAAPWTRLDDLHRASLAELVQKFAIHAVTDADLDQLSRLWHRLRPWPDSVSGLVRLKARYLIGPLSNGNFSLMVRLARYAELPWSFVLGSDLFRHYKPDPETYLGAAALLDIRPDQLMLAAAHNGDLTAARKLGLHTGFFPRPMEHRAGQTTDLAATEDWDVVAHDIEDLAAKLGA
jgi:2-haloacid dehalogenase